MSAREYNKGGLLLKTEFAARKPNSLVQELALIKGRDNTETDIVAPVIPKFCT